MGLESQLANVSSESIPILMFTMMFNCVCYLRSRFHAILQRIGLLSLNNHQNNEVHDSTSDAVGSGLARVVMLAEQLNLNRVFSCKYEEKKTGNEELIGVEDQHLKCVVCLNCVEVGDQVRKLACRHVFHKSCFDGWINQLNFSCPLCRSSLISDESVESTRRRLLGKDALSWFSSLRHDGGSSKRII